MQYLNDQPDSVCLQPPDQQQATFVVSGTYISLPPKEWRYIYIEIYYLHWS